MQKRAQFDDRIRNLITLARDQSEQSRSLLFSHICDLFLQGRPMESAVQIQMLTEILKELLVQVTLSVRQEVATVLCAMTAPPEALINIICEDVVDVSGPLLEKAILPDEKLIHIIRYGTEAHKVHISRRFGLSPLVRYELERSWQQSQDSRPRVSLNDLDKQAEIPGLDEETTANILELLRAQHIHNLSPEPSALPEVDIIGTPENSLTNPSPKPSPEPSEDYLLPPDIFPQNSSDEDNIIFNRDTAANDAAAPRDISPPDSIIQMEPPASTELTDDVWQQLAISRSKTNRQQEFVRTSADWFWEIDRDGLVTFLSEEAFTVFGEPCSTLTGADFISLCSAVDDSFSGGKASEALVSNLDSLFERRAPFRDIPCYITAKNHEKSRWYISAIAIFDIHTGRFSGFRGSARAETPAYPVEDASSVSEMSSSTLLTPSGQQEQVLENYIATQALQAASPNSQNSGHRACNEQIAAELLQNLSHEFRTPLNAIIGFSEMINMETWGPVNELYHQNIKNILAAAFRLKEAVNDVLDSAKLEAGLMQIKPESFSLKSVLKNCQDNVASLAAEKHLTFHDNDDNIDVILYNDMQSVELCLTKMLTSIIRRADDGETLSLSVLMSSAARIRIEIPVLGPKIDEKSAEEIFHKLEIRKDSQKNHPQTGIKLPIKISSGFGLSIAQSLAHLIGGDISIHCTQGYLTHLVLTMSNPDLSGKP